MALLSQLKDPNIIGAFVKGISDIRNIVSSLIKKLFGGFRKVLIQKEVHEALAS